MVDPRGRTTALRDRALICSQWLWRRDGLVALDVADLAWQEHGLRITIQRFKTDQEGQGAVVTVPEGDWLTPSPICASGWQRRGLWNARFSADLEKRPVRDARDYPIMQWFASLRLGRSRPGSIRRNMRAWLVGGVVIEAARNGAEIWKFQQLSRQKSMQILSTYVRNARPFDDHAGDPLC